MTKREPDASPEAWRRALANGAAAQLESIYADAARAIADRAPACWASGRCCNFDAFGHRLYTTGLEAAYCVDRWNQRETTPLTVGAVNAAVARGGCPFQQSNLCHAHDIKPLACRLFFCDRTADEWQSATLERLHAEIKAIHNDSIPYEYAEWRTLLARLASA